MRIAVLAKQVPDTGSPRRLDPVDFRRVRDSDWAIDEICERALEIALQATERSGGEVVLVSMGPGDVGAALRPLLATGADSAVVLTDDALRGADAMTTARALAAVLTTLDVDLILAGNESTDGRGGVVPVMIAERLGLPAIDGADRVEIGEGEVVVERETDASVVRLRSTLPAVVSVTERSASPRFPGLRGLMAAKRKPVRVLTMADLDVAAGPHARSTVVALQEAPGRDGGIRIPDDEQAVGRLIEFLESRNAI